MELPAHQLTMTVLMTPDTANFAGNVHGGTLLRLLDQVAYACASRYAGRYVVTLSVDRGFESGRDQARAGVRPRLTNQPKAPAVKNMIRL